MRRLFLICCIAVLVLSALSCAPEATLEVSVTEIDDDVVIQNAGNVDCIVFVSSPDGEQQFQLTAGGNVTVTDIAQPFEVSAVSLRDNASES